MPKLKHYDNLGTARFVTFSCYRRLKGFKREGVFRLFLKHLQRARIKHNFKLFGYVIMPKHVHLVILPSSGSKLGLIIREIKSNMAREYFSEVVSVPSGETHVFWQRRCYDHNCRTPETVVEKINYCHYNPVVRGLVKSPGEWIWSSYKWYQGMKDVPIRMDKIE